MSILLKVKDFSRDHNFDESAIKLGHGWILDIIPMPNSTSMIKELVVSDKEGDIQFYENFSYDIVQRKLSLSRNTWKIIKNNLKEGDKITIIQEDFGPELKKPENKESITYTGEIEVIDSCGKFYLCTEARKIVDRFENNGIKWMRDCLENFGYKNPNKYLEKRILMIKFKNQDQPVLMTFSDFETKYTICL